jgi:hypothetical protein
VRFQGRRLLVEERLCGFKVAVCHRFVKVGHEVAAAGNH